VPDGSIINEVGGEVEELGRGYLAFLGNGAWLGHDEEVGEKKTGADLHT
jgi:hypothetical protein